MRVIANKAHDVRLPDGTVKACFPEIEYDFPAEVISGLVGGGAFRAVDAAEAKAVSGPPENKAQAAPATKSVCAVCGNPRPGHGGSDHPYRAGGVA